MNRTILLSIIFLICSLSIVYSRGELTEEEIEYQIKNYLNNLQNLNESELMNIIKDEGKNQIFRMAAVRQIGVIGTEKVISELIEEYRLLDNKWKQGPRKTGDLTLNLIIEISKAVVSIDKREKKITDNIGYWIKIIKTHYNEKGGDIYFNGASSLLTKMKYTNEGLIELSKYKNDKDTRVRRHLIIAIINNPVKITLPILIELIQDEDWGNRYWAIKAIEKIGDKSAIPHLQKVLNNKNENEKVRKAAEEAIKSLSK